MFTVFNQYPTFLVFLAVVFAMVVTMVLTPLWIKFLKSSHIGQQVRADGPESHLVKQGTPTMGGVIMLIAVIAVALFVGMPTPETFVLLAATVLTGLLGLVDDASKVVKERSLGLTPKAKIVGQVAIATAFVLVAVNWLGIQPTVEIPFVVTLDFGILTTVVPVGDGIAIPWLYQRREPHRRPGWFGGGHGHDRDDRDGGHRVPFRSVGTRYLRRRARGRVHRVPLVQLVSGRHLHGRHRIARAGHGAGLPGRAHED